MRHLAEAKKLSADLKKFVRESDKLDFSKTLEDGQKSATARIFEFYVSLRSIKTMSEKWNLRVVGPSHDKTLRFPHGPANKVNYPYFVATNRDTSRDAFQICLGTNISNADGTTFAPDLSIQTPDSPSTPGCNDFVFGWDQKYTTGPRLSRDETAKVASHLRVVPPEGLLEVGPFPPGSWPNSCAIVTNADFSTYQDADLAKLKMSEVSDCNPWASQLKTRP